MVHEPALCIVLQGTKRVMLAERVYEYGPTHHLVVSFDLPIVGQVVEAEPERPYLCLRLDIAPTLLSELAADLPREPRRERDAAPSGPGLLLGRTSPDILDAAGRLLRLAETPADVPALAPLYERELLYRVVSAPGGGAAMNAVLGVGAGPRVARAIAWLKHHYREPFDMDRLTSAAGLQASALHHHFKAITLVSPLQYHKRLRLLEARRAMLFQHRNAADAAFSVGYASPSQFSREYRRHFGRSPVRDVEALGRAYRREGRPSAAGST